MSAEHCDNCDPAFSCWSNPETCRKPDSRAHCAVAVGSPSYFVLPNLPRDVWYGYADKPESAQLVAFVEQRHAHIKPGFDAEYLAVALNAHPLFRRFSEAFSMWVAMHPKESAPWAKVMNEAVASVAPFLENTQVTQEGAKRPN